MNRQSIMNVIDLIRVPRVCGDEPDEETQEWVIELRSPRMRG